MCSCLHAYLFIFRKAVITWWLYYQDFSLKDFISLCFMKIQESSLIFQNILKIILHIQFHNLRKWLYVGLELLEILWLIICWKMTGMTSLFWSKASMLHKLSYFDETNASIVMIIIKKCACICPGAIFRRNCNIQRYSIWAER